MTLPEQNLNISNIAEQLESENSRDRLRALVSLRDLSPEDAVPLILKVIDDENLQIRSMAVFALGLKHTDDCFPVLAKILETETDYGIRADAAGAMGYLQDNRAVEPLLRAFYEDTEWLVRFSAAVSLGNLGDVRAYDALMQALESSETMLHQAAIAALGLRGLRIEAVLLQVRQQCIDLDVELDVLALQQHPRRALLLAAPQQRLVELALRGDLVRRFHLGAADERFGRLQQRHLRQQFVA